MIKITVTGSEACASGLLPLVAGTVGQTVELSFDEAWQSLQKTAVFQCSGKTLAVLDVDALAVIPWELMKKPGCRLYAGVFGVGEDGTVQTPTVWVDLGVIQPGADPTVEESADPTLPVWQQVYEKVDAAVRESMTAARESGEFTPVRGVDYWTQADKAEMVNAVLAALPDGDGVSY